MQPVILSGGFGTRLWPSSREFLPKQFIRFFLNEKTLFQQTIKRVRNVFPEKNILILINKIHKNIALDQLNEISEENFSLCLEPHGRNTFPALLLAASFFNENKTIFVAASDHLIEGESFESDVKSACKFANDNKKIVVFGINPCSPETGYGYIKPGEKLQNEIFSVEKFTEKPSLDIAKKYLENGKYFWNSGMFAIPISLFLNDTQKFENDSYLAFLEMKDDIRELIKKTNIIEPNETIFSKFRKESLDYAIIEKTENIAMIKSNFQWNDLGDWKSIHENSKNKDENQNIISKNVISINNKNSYIMNHGQIKIAAAGLENIIIVAENDSILILNKSHSQDVKKIVDEVKKECTDCLLHPTFENRPWGNFNTLFCRQNTKVKQLIIKPTKKLSLQSHNHRSEHWIVTKGTATVVLNEKQIEVKENESIFIPKNAKHRIENKQKEDLVIIEVQIGNYLGEDDIKRYQDDWGRS